MEKIAFNDWKNSMSFMIDDSFDNNFLHKINPIVDLINSSAHFFSDEQKLVEYLTTDSGKIKPLMKLKSFVSVIGLSEERLKRVVSLIRAKHFDEFFNTEWSFASISKSMQSNVKLRSLLIDFFINGRESFIGEDMPLYYMRNFKLKDSSFINDLRQPSYVERILNDNEIQGRYSNKVGEYVEKQLIKIQLEKYKANVNPNLNYESQKEFHLLNKNIDFLIPSTQSPSILIESVYNITTGSSQSKRADQLVEHYSILMKHNANQKDRKIIMVNYVDGLGWIGRQNDLRRIYEASDFVMNQKTLFILDDIIDNYY